MQKKQQQLMQSHTNTFCIFLTFIDLKSFIQFTKTQTNKNLHGRMEDEIYCVICIRKNIN